MNLFANGVHASSEFDPKRASAPLSLWLDANDPYGNKTQPSNGSSLSTWVDKSSSGNTFTAGVAPTFYNNILNNRPAIRFNGTSSYLVKSSPSGFNFGTGDYSFYLVVVDRRTASLYSHYIAMPNQTTWALKRYDSDGNVYNYNGSTSWSGENTTVGIPWVASFNRNSGTRYWRWNNLAYSVDNLLLYPKGYYSGTDYNQYWSTSGSGVATPGSYGGDWAFGYSPSADQMFYQNVSGFKIGKSYTASITVSNRVDGNLLMQIDSGALLNVNISGNSTYTGSFVATAFTHQFKIWGQANTVTNAQVNFTNPSVKITNSGDLISTGDTQNLNPTSLNIGNGHPSEFSNSDISEIIVYNGTLTNKDHNNIYTYLKSKWGL